MNCNLPSKNAGVDVILVGGSADAVAAPAELDGGLVDVLTAATASAVIVGGLLFLLVNGWYGRGSM